MSKRRRLHTGETTRKVLMNMNDKESARVNRVKLDLTVQELFLLVDRIEAATECDRFDAYYAAKAQRPDLYDLMTSFPPAQVDRALDRFTRQKATRAARAAGRKNAA